MLAWNEHSCSFAKWNYIFLPRFGALSLDSINELPQKPVMKFPFIYMVETETMGSISCRLALSIS